MIPLFKVSVDTEKVLEALRTPLEEGWLTEGKKVAEVEELFQKHLGSAVKPLAVNSCTSALTLAYRLAGVGPGSYVATVATTCTATNMPILNLGASPVFVDVNPMTGCIDPEHLRSILYEMPMIEAITVVHWGGYPVDIEAIKEIADGRPIIEDCAHVFSSTYDDGAMIGSSGNYCCFSNQAIKFWTCADGGFLVCPDDATRERARLLRWYGISREVPRMDQDAAEDGYKFHMNDFNATMLLANYDITVERVGLHRDNAFALSMLTSCVPKFKTNCNYWITTGIFKDPWEIKTRLAEAGYFADQVHRRNDEIAVFQKNAVCSNLPGTDEFYAHMMAVPTGWWVEDMASLMNAINDVQA